MNRIFVPKREEAKGDKRTLHNEELHNLYCSPDIKNDAVDITCSTHTNLWSKYPKTPLGRSTR